MNKKDKIIQTAIKLFAENGFHNTSTARIAAEAGTASGLIFHHFGNKEGLLKHVIDFLRGRISQILYIDKSQEPSQALIQLIERLQIIQEEKDFWFLYQSLVFQPGLTEILIVQLKGVFQQYTQDLETLFAQLDYPDPHQTMLTFEAQRSGILISYMLERGDYPIRAMLQNLTEFSKKQ